MMLPQINGKDLISCSEDDFAVLIDNTDYRENEYIDYKLTFAYLEMYKGKARDAKKTEFKNDVCSFANADGGYLIFGIRDNNGCAMSIEGIEIPNNDTDLFELNRRNDLNGIQPRVPQVQFGFIRLKSGKFVVVLQIKHDSFSPYVYLEDEKNYYAYKRYGNGKKAMSYTELRQMFNQSLSLEHAISSYRQDRIDYYRKIGKPFGNSFLHLCIIPDTFTDNSNNVNMYILERTGKLNLSSLFSSFNCSSSSIPCVDGLRFLPYREYTGMAECYVKNNGIVEASFFLDTQLDKDTEQYPNGFLPWEWLWDKISKVCRQYYRIIIPHLRGTRAFICLSLVGCKDVQTNPYDIWHDYVGKIDRDEVYCDPVEIVLPIQDDESELTIKRMYLSYILALGVKYNEKLQQLVNDLYGIH